MKDLTLIHNILKKFEGDGEGESPAFVYFNDLDDRGSDIFMEDPTFVRHLLWVMETGLISNTACEYYPIKEAFGISKHNWGWACQNKELRLTDLGVETLKHMNDSRIFSQLQDKFSHFSAEVLLECAKSLAKGTLTEFFLTK